MAKKVIKKLKKYSNPEYPLFSISIHHNKEWVETYGNDKNSWQYKNPQIEMTIISNTNNLDKYLDSANAFHFGRKLFASDLLSEKDKRNLGLLFKEFIRMYNI